MRKYIILSLLAIVILVSIIVAVYFATQKSDRSIGNGTKDNVAAEKYSKAAVSSDSPVCSDIGKDILVKGGNAVDSAVAALFCAGVVNLHSTGIGGGGFAVIYSSQDKKVYVYDYRETAPAGAYERMYADTNASSVIGGMAIAVPGEVKGLHLMWKEHGKLNWSQLVEPSRKLAADGFPVPEPVHSAIRSSKSKIENSPGLRALLMKNGEFLKFGDKLQNTALAKTMEIIRDTPDSFYSGSFANKVIKDISDAKGNISLDDLKNYKVEKRKVLKSGVKKLTIHGIGPPGGGSVVAMILNILEGYGFNKKNVETDDAKIASFHKIIEAFKWAYAKRALLGDPKFLKQAEIDKVVSDMLNQTIADRIRRNKIWLNQTFSNSSYYGGFFGEDDYGTSHTSVLDANGMAVSATGTINYYFGSGVRSVETGIIYNNEMDDFSTPGAPNLYKYPPTKANFIRPGKRPLSSMAPLVITDDSGKVKMVVGASGGSKIITGVALTVINKIMFDMELGAAIVSPRFHNQLIPNITVYETKHPLSLEVRKGLEKLGHRLGASLSKSVVQGIFVDKDVIYAKADPRKQSRTAGY